MNYFELYGWQPKFFIDEKELRNKYIALSRTNHPDYFMDSEIEIQNENFDFSTLNNIAYKTLSNFDSRMEYILNLELNEAFQEEKLHNEFLMEMMEINESIMELEFDFDAEKLKQLQTDVENMEKDNFEAIKPILLSFDNQSFEKKDLLEIKKYFLKKKYLLRIRNQFSKFASHS